MKKKAPRLSCGEGSRRTPILFGRSSNYGMDLEQKLWPGEFLAHFRFAPSDIPRLVTALQIPDEIVAGGCRIDGEEALLIFLKRFSYANRHIDLVRFFGRSVGFISTICKAVLLHLAPIANKLLMEFDHRRLQPLMKLFAAAIHAKAGGHCLDNIWAFIDGTFRAFCRPGKDGYSGMAQRAVWTKRKKKHGSNNQGIETPDGIIVEMHGPFQGQYPLYNNAHLKKRPRE